MRDELSGDDPKNVWQKQKTEVSTMSMEVMQERARVMQARTQSELWKNAAVGGLAVVLSGVGMIWAKDTAPRIVFAVASGWAVAGQYFLHRGLWAESPTPGTGARSGVQLYRDEIARRQRLFHRIVLCLLGPVLMATCGLGLTIALIALRTHGLGRMIPFLTLFAIWIIAVAMRHVRGQRKLRGEAAALDSEYER